MRTLARLRRQLAHLEGNRLKNVRLLDGGHDGLEVLGAAIEHRLDRLRLLRNHRRARARVGLQATDLEARCTGQKEREHR